MHAKLKIRKQEEEPPRRRARTDYQNIKKMIDNFTKPTPLLDSNKLTSFSRVVQHYRQESKITASYRREKNSSATILATDHKDSAPKSKTGKFKDLKPTEKPQVIIKTSRNSKDNCHHQKTL